MKIIKTKKILDKCLEVYEYSNSFKCDYISLIAEKLNVDINDLRRINAVFYYRINKGLSGNPYYDDLDKKLYNLYEVFAENRNQILPELKKYCRMDIIEFENVSDFNDDYQRPDLEKIPDIYPESKKTFKVKNLKI